MIRAYQESDRNAILKLLSKEELNPETNEPWDMEFFSSRYNVLIDEDIKGVICYSSQLGTLEINFIFVSPEVRGSGLARKLVDAIPKKGFDGIRVNCGQENKRAQQFYERLGFEKVGEVKNYFSNNNIQFFFWKSLTGR